MPKTWEDPENEGGGGEFLKLQDGESALIVLMDAPMITQKHTIKDGSQYGTRFYCGTNEGLGCPICEDEEGLYDADTKRRSTEGFYSVWVESITKKGAKSGDPVQRMMMDVGGWSKVGAYVETKKAQEADGEEFAGVPMRLTRTGAGKDTRYSIQMRPKAEVNIDGEPIDVEARALAMLAKDHASVGYVPDVDRFAGHPGDPDEDDGMEDIHAANLDIMNGLAKEAKLVNPATLKAFLKSKNVVVRGPQDYPAAIQALEERIASVKAKTPKAEDESPFDFEDEYEENEEAEPTKTLAGGRVRK